MTEYLPHTFWITPETDVYAVSTEDTARDLEHVKLLAERIETYLRGVQEARTIAEKQGDADTVDLLTAVIRDFEKNGWFLRAALEG